MHDLEQTINSLDEKDPQRYQLQNALKDKLRNEQVSYSDDSNTRLCWLGVSEQKGGVTILLFILNFILILFILPFREKMHAVKLVDKQCMT